MKESHSLWALHRDDETTAPSATVIVPTRGPGRWFKIAPGGGGNSGFEHVLDIRDYGGVADSTTDNTPAFNAMLAASQTLTNAGPPNLGSKSASTTVWYLPSVRNETYHFAGTFTLPNLKNIIIRSDRSAGAILSCVDDYVLDIAAGTGVQQWRGFRGLAFYRCGVRVGYNVRSNLIIQDNLFYDTPATGLLLESQSGTPGDLGSQVWGRVIGNRFDSCTYGIRALGDQSDLWVLHNNGFVRGKLTDVELWTSGWQLRGNGWEQRDFSGGDGSRPWLNLRQGRVQVLDGNRFGNEVAAGGTRAPPAYCIIVGDPDTAESGHLNFIVIDGVNFRGRSGGATATSAVAAIRIRKSLRSSRIGRRNSYDTYLNGIVDLAHSSLARGDSNTLEGGVRQFTDASQALLSLGSIGAWDIRGKIDLDFGSGFSKATQQQLPNSKNLDLWTSPNANCAATPSTEIGPDGELSAFELTRSAADTASIFSSFVVEGDGPVTFSVYLKLNDPPSETRSSLRVLRGSEWLNDLANIYELTNQWQRIQVTVYPGDAVTVQVHIAIGQVGSSSTSGTILCALPTASYGYGVPDWQEENFYWTGEAAELQAPQLIASGTATASGGATVDGILTLEEGFSYDIRIRATGLSATNGHALEYESTLKALRGTGGGAVVLSGTPAETLKEYYVVATGAVAPIGEADPADITVTIGTSGDDITASLSNADATQNVDTVRIWVEYTRTKLDP